MRCTLTLVLLSACAGLTAQSSSGSASSGSASSGSASSGSASSESASTEPARIEGLIDIGSRREPLVDGHLFARMEGTELVVQQPTPREVVLVTDKPWEGNTCAYYVVFRDGKKLRMYYRGSHYDETRKRAGHREVTCYVESSDGVRWTKPELGLVEFGGSKKNNIVWDGVGTHCFTPFLDTNPKCKPEARYKAIARGRPRGKKGLYVFQSPDGLRWKRMHDGPVITEGAFDSQNLAFFDPQIGVYREYHRTFTRGVRAIMTGTSKDFVKWTAPKLLEYGDAPNEHLYTNAVLPYPRAPHLLLGFPTRFLPKQGQRVEPVFMASRDGLRFRRYADALIPEDAPKDRSGNRSNYMAWGLVALPGAPDELSVYATEAYYTGPDSRVRRFTFRVDGFVAARAKGEGELLTKPLRFTGKQLHLNFKTGAKGSVRCAIETATGESIPGFEMADCSPLSGDEVDAAVRWKGNLQQLTGRAIQLRFALHRAELFALQFR